MGRLGRLPFLTSAARLPLERLLRPRSIAIVGASDKPGALGASVLANLEAAGFAGVIHLVNPRRDTIGGRACLATIDDLPEGVDAAVLAIPRDGVLEAMRGLARRRAGAVVIFSAGFAEAGAEGVAEQAEIARIAAEAGMVVEGPNCLGHVNFRDRVPLSFIDLPEPDATRGRHVGIVSQSGAMAAVLATTLIARRVPLTGYISTGNEAASGIEDFLEHLAADPNTEVIALIAEHIRHPARFLAAARGAQAAGKPVVLLHPGRSTAAAASAATHTGALAGDHAVMRVHVARAGVILVESLETLGDVVELAARSSGGFGGGVGVIAESGAFKAILLDLAEAVSLALPLLNDADSPALRAALPAFVPVSNPLDITAQGLVDPGIYDRTLAALAGDERIAAILMTLIQTKPDSAHRKFAAVTEALRRIATRKPVIVAGVDEGGGVLAADIETLRELGVPYLPSAERALRALASLGATAAALVHSDETVAPLDDLPPPGCNVPEHRAKALLGARGLPFGPGHLVGSAEAAIAAADTLGYPVVLKAQAGALPHKSDAGGVVVDLIDAGAVRAGWARLHASLADARPGLALDGVLVEPMAAPGVELIVGARRDPDWGPVLLIGFGGVAAELLHDVRLLPIDLCEDAIMAEIRKLRLAPLLGGFRGAPPLDVRALARLVRDLGRIVAATPAIREVDLNPVRVYGKGALALDALISC